MMPSLSLVRTASKPRIQRRAIFTVLNGTDSISKSMRSENPNVFLHKGINIIEKYKDKNSYLTLTNHVQNNEIVPKLPIVMSADIGLVAAEAVVLTDPESGNLRPFAFQWMGIFLAKYPGIKHVVVFACNSAVAIPHGSSSPSAIIQFSEYFSDIPFYGVVHPLKLSKGGGKLTRTEIDSSGVVTLKEFDILSGDFRCAKNGKFFSAMGIDIAKML